MKNRELIDKIARDQQNEISAICTELGITQSVLAKEAGIAPSTINRFMNYEQPSYALSSVTMEKIREAQRQPRGADAELEESGPDEAYIYAFNVIFDLLADKIVRKNELESAFIKKAQDFQTSGLRDAALVLKKLTSALSTQQPRSEIQVSRKQQRHHQG